MPTINLLSQSGEVVDNMEISEDFVGVTVNTDALHQVVVAQLANKRWGTANTKTRSDVRGGGRKMYRQKGTGRARMGSRSSPTRVHGGVAFGPKPRSFRKHVSKKLRQLALHSALADKFQSGNVVILNAITMEHPRTKDLVELLHNIGLENKTLIVLDADNPNLYLSARNIPKVNVSTWNLVNTYDILWHDNLVMTQAAAQKLEQKFCEHLSHTRDKQPAEDLTLSNEETLAQ